jgi:hypothetical protein
MLFVVHCVDAEGPLFESIEATFHRLEAMFGLRLAPSAELLKRLQNCEEDLGSRDLAQAIARAFAPEQLAYNPDWPTLDAMLDRLDSPEIRRALPDSYGNKWRVNWHCVAHWGFDPDRNPRRRELGVHSVFDHYSGRYGLRNEHNSLHWHFHPVAFSRSAHHSATSYFNSPALFEIVSRRVLERLWFPCVNRPGFHAERPDSHWFLEQWLPYDIANINMKENGEQELFAGRWHDWRRAPEEWVVYHPDHDDYQRPGNCRRGIARCLNLGGRYACITQAEVDKAFASSGNVVMAFTNHDFRDVAADVQSMQVMLKNASARFPGVKWRYADAAEAMRAALGHGDEPHAHFSVSLDSLRRGVHRLDVRLDRQPFGPQPWLCFSTRDGRTLHDNLAVGMSARHWFYVFDEQTAPLQDVVEIGLAVNTKNGRTTVMVLDVAKGIRRDNFLN